MDNDKFDGGPRVSRVGPEFAPPPMAPSGSDSGTQPGLADPLGPPTHTPPPHLESASDRRERSGLPAAVWLGLLGSGLVILAIVGVVVSQWDSIGEVGRALGLSALGVGGLMVAFKLKPSTPSMAALLAHLDVVVIAASAIAVMSAFGFGWPSCLVVGGSAGAAAAIILDRHWQPSRFMWLEVSGITAASFGCAALVPQPPLTVGLVVALAALVELQLGRARRAGVLAGVAVMTPLLSILYVSGVGEGTLVDAGAAGPRLIWSGPVVGVLSAIVLLRVGRALNTPGLRPFAAAALVCGFFTGLVAAGTNPIAAWMSLPGAILLILEAGRVSVGANSRDRLRPLSDLVAGVVGLLVVVPWGALTIALSYAAGHPDPARLSAWETYQDRTEWMVFPALFGLLGLMVWWWVTRPRTEIRNFCAGTSIGVVGTALVFGVGAPVVVASVVASIIAVAAALLGRPREIAYPLAAFALAQAGVLIGTGVQFGGSWVEYVAAAECLVILGALVGATTSTAARRGDNGFLEMMTVGGFGGLAIAVFVTPIVPIGGLGAWFLIGTAALTSAQVLIDRHAGIAQIWSLGVASGFVILIFQEEFFDSYFRPEYPAELPGVPSYLVGTSWGFGAMTLAAAHGWWRVRDRFSTLVGMASSALVGGLAATTVVAAGFELRLDRLSLVLILGAIGVVSIGLSSLTSESTMFAVSGCAAAVYGLVLGPSGYGWISSLLIIIVGLQAAVWGGRLGYRLVVGSGVVVAGFGALSLIWTTPAIDIIERLASKVDATPADVALLIATVASLVGGEWVRRRTLLSSWPTLGPGLSIGLVWLLTVAASRITLWALPLGLVLGVGAVAIGARGRLAAPMVIGTGLVVGIVLVSYRTYLGNVPMWVWLGIGGATLLTVAVGIERVSRRGMTLSDLIDRWD